MFKIKQKSVRVLLIVTTIVVALVGSLFILLNISFVQNSIRKKIVSELTQTLHTRVEIGKLTFRPFSRFLLQNVYLEDQHKDTLIAAQQMSVHLDFWKLFSNKVSVSTAEFDRINFNLKVDSTGKSNFDFVLKAFASTDTTPKKMKIVFNVDRFRLNDGHFRLTNIDKTVQSKLFDASHLDVHHINLDLTLRRFASDTLSADIHSLSCIEKSGLVIKELQTTLRANRKQLQMAYLNVTMPDSKLKINNLSLVYGSFANIRHFVQKVKIGCTILPSQLSPHDFACFLPQFAKFDDHFNISTQLTGTVANFRCKNLNITNGNSFRFLGNFDISGLPDINETFVFANVNQLNVSVSQMQDIVAHLSGKPFVLPGEVLRLGNIHFNGSLTGFFSEMVAYGNLSTRLGNVSTDMKLEFSKNLNKLLFSGSVKTKNFQLGELLNSSDVGRISLQAKLQGKSEVGKPFSTTAKATISSITLKQYTYNNLSVDGAFDGTKFDGKASMQDPNIHLELLGLIDLSKKRPEYKFSADIQNFTPNKLNLLKNYPNLNISFKMAANLQGDLMKDADGTVVFNNIAIINNKKIYLLNNITINALPSTGSNNRLDINSDLISGYCQGKYNFIKLPKDILFIASRYLPSLLHADEKNVSYNNFAYKLTANPEQTGQLMDALDLPVQMEKGATLEGNFNADVRQMNFILDIPSFSSNKTHFSKLRVTCENLKNAIQLSAKGMMLQGDNSVMNLFASMSAEKDSVNTRFLWDNSTRETYAGEVVAHTKLFKENNQLWANTRLLPTQIILNDSAWNIRPGSFSTDMKTVWIKDFSIDRQQQYLHINGILSDRTSDSLNVEIQSVKLEHLSKMLHLISPSLNGTVTGKITLLSALKRPIIKANIFAQNFGLNNTVWGDTYAETSWDEINHRMNAVGKVIHNKDTVAYLAGGYYLAKDSMAFLGYAKQLPISFLNTYLSSFLTNPKGFATGNIGMYVVKGRIWFDGDVDVKEGQGGLSYLNTTYFFSDTVHLRKNSIILNNIAIHDAENNQGTLTCIANHSDFKNWTYDVRINANNLLALNTKETDNDNFWGRAYASGTVRVNGDDKTTRVTINATSQPKTNAYISIGGAESAADNSFIDYVVKKKRNDSSMTNQQIVNKPAVGASSHETVINATLAITPEAQIHLIVDPKAGDKIDALGSGTLSIGYNLNNHDLQMRGSYTINEGKYLFTFQNALSREFKIDKGSTIRWNGTAYNALIDINARYQLTASLADLMDADLLKSTARTSVQVECLLNLTGNLMKPDIKFDINLPNSREELQRSVKNIISTNEMMNRQIIYLLAIGKFYTPDYQRSSTTGFIGQNDILSAATSTLSNQLNNWLSQAIKGVNLGVNIRSSGAGEMTGTDYEAAIMYENNRWIINGNVGYRNDNFSTSKFIGDVDIQYLLSQNGKWRIRGYNRTNDYKQLNPAPYTQGLGVTYTENFNSFSELLKGYWESFKSLFKKKKTKK